MPRTTEIESSGSIAQKHPAWGEESKGQSKNTVPCLSGILCTNAPPPAAFLLRIRSSNSTQHIITEGQHNTMALVLCYEDSSAPGLCIIFRGAFAGQTHACYKSSLALLGAHSRRVGIILTPLPS